MYQRPSRGSEYINELLACQGDYHIVPIRRNLLSMCGCHIEHMGRERLIVSQSRITCRRKDGSSQ